MKLIQKGEKAKNKHNNVFKQKYFINNNRMENKKYKMYNVQHQNIYNS